MLMLVGATIIAFDLVFNYQIFLFFAPYRIYWVGITLLFVGCLFSVFAYFAFLWGAKPVLDRELLGKNPQKESEKEKV